MSQSPIDMTAGRSIPPLLLRIRGLGKAFGSSIAVKSVDLDIPEGAFVTLLGPSGCGKTTILRMVAGFETASHGTIELDGVSLGSLPPERRPVNTVFQSYALFPHMTVFENVAFSMALKRRPRSAIEARVNQALAVVHMSGFSRRYPGELSGGQQQRVALARAIVGEPRLLLLDEPLSALDRMMREHMQVELKDIQRRLGIAFVYVTHDQEEAFALSDIVVVMNGGEIIQSGPPETIYQRPADIFVADFIGGAAVVRGRVTALSDGRAALDCPIGQVEAPCVDGLRVGGSAVLTVRPENVVLGDAARAAPTRCPGVVRHSIYQGGRSLVEVEVAGVILRSWRDAPVPVGQQFDVGIITDRVWITHG